MINSCHLIFPHSEFIITCRLWRTEGSRVLSIGSSLMLVRNDYRYLHSTIQSSMGWFHRLWALQDSESGGLFCALHVKQTRWKASLGLCEAFITRTNVLRPILWRKETRDATPCPHRQSPFSHSINKCEAIFS